MKYKVSEKIKDYYDNASINKIKDYVYGNARVEKAWQTIRTYVNNPSSILEIGCGIGAMSDRLSKQWPDAKITGIDISERSIEIATKLFQSDNCKFFTKLPSEEDNKKKYDLILLIDVIEHVEKKQRPELLTFIESNLKENGMLLLAFPTPHMLDINRKHFPEKLQPVEENIHINDLQNISEIIKQPLVLYKEIFVWQKRDYAHAIFCEQLIENPESKISLREQVKTKVKSKLIHKSEQNILELKQKMIFSKLQISI